jgi:hypothetical protein
MLDSIGTFDVSTRVRELESSITRRIREALRPHIRDNDVLESTTHELLTVSKDFAGSFHAINNRERIRRERDAE